MRRWVILAAMQPMLCATGHYVGPEACRRCHLSIYETQSKTRHFRALSRIQDTQLPSLLADAPIQERNGLSFAYELAGNDPRVIVRRGDRRLEASLTWAFGAGSQAVTPVGVYNGRFFEHRVSYYTSAMRPGRTLGHPGAPSASVEGALGLFQDSETIQRCFDCHATAVRPGPDLTGATPGVSCERCHQAGSDHVASQSARDIAALSRLSPSRSVLFCAQCHRGPEPGASLDTQLRDPMSIRFQPLGLLASDCYRKSGSLSCITCHNPHEDARHDAAHYVRKCIICHPKAPARTAKCARATRSNCLPCHMQRRSPADFLSFTDHRIRVYP